MTKLQRLRLALIESGEFDLVVADSTFRVVSIDLEAIGELWLGLVWSLDYPELGAYSHLVSWELFGEDGLN
jgi:hypothetical protein